MPDEDPKLSVDDVLAECLRDPESYYHGSACRLILTAWDGTTLDGNRLIQAKIFLDRLVDSQSRDKSKP